MRHELNQYPPETRLALCKATLVAMEQRCPPASRVRRAQIELARPVLHSIMVEALADLALAGKR